METPTLTTNGTDAATAETPHWAFKPFKTAAVLGAGVMGSQIAAHLANAGLDVLLLDVTPEAIGREGKKNDLVEGAFKDATRMKPDPFFTKAAQKRITLGNFDDDFDKIGEADWIIEVVVERMDVKQDVMGRIEAAASDTAVISTNTSGLPIGEIAEGRSDAFKRRFLGTHFFNPPRYLKLFEVIPTPDTDPEVVARVSSFARVHLGKGIVVAKDTPNFIGNRIGTYAMLGAVQQFESGDYSIEEIDALTGTLIGHAKSATFRTADVVGLDTLHHVTKNLYEAIPEDESRERFQVPDVLRRLVELKQLGAKTKAGFYKKEGKVIKSFDPESGEYVDPKEVGFDVKPFKKAGGLAERLKALWADDGRAGQFFRTTTLDLIGYTARRTPEISDSPSNIDRALQWGFGWEMGPYQIWDVLGIDEVRAELLPEQKVAAIEDLVATHKMVAMIGDGVNDAPAMARAHIGVAMGAIGSDAAVETADIALMTDDIGKLPWLVGHSRRTMWVIRQNIGLSLATKAAFAGLTAFGMASMWGAIAADVGVSLLVVMNALRLLQGRADPHIPDGGDRAGGPVASAALAHGH